ncbi:TonB family protein [Sphingobium sp. DEHP117]|uniref:energy transducer TonB n=1 Tax=Sphingobium sp. DEHP117 TaxID=2993436 RepID=UPI0027D71739|nr:TonB family protein [Sphingobium sp. DEHP117]MDQ4420521.1 TonB family protein [Sphingobium sp. DEHP117]
MQWILNNNRTIDTGYTGKRASPLAIGATIAVHVAIGGLVYMLPPGTIRDVVPDVIWITNVPVEKPKEEARQDKGKEQPLQRAARTDKPVEPRIEPLDPVGTAKDPPIGDPAGGGGAGSGAGTQTVEHQPVLVAAIPDPRRLPDFQPDYPAAMIRAQTEGYATVRVHISASGRVETVELIDTNDSAFWKATRKQALERWRFRPATRDGVAEPSEKVMTVRFRLSDL